MKSKKIYLLTFAALILFGFGFKEFMTNSYPASGPANIEGLNLQGSGQVAPFSIPAANKINFGFVDASVFLQITPGSVDVQGYQFTSYQRGGLFGNTAGGYALTATEKSYLAYNPGSYTLNGQGSSWDGISRLQNKGRFSTDTFHTSSGNVGDILTKASDGNYYPQPVATNTSSGTYAPTATGISNVTSVVVYQTGKWDKNGNIVDVSIGISLKYTANNATTQFTISLPTTINTTTATPQTACGSGVLYLGGGATTFIGTIPSGNNTITFTFVSALGAGSFYDCNLHFKYVTQ